MSSTARKKPELVELEPQHVAVIRKTVPISQLRDVFDHGFSAVLETLEKQAIAPSGPPVGIYHGMPTDTVDVSVGFPTEDAVADDGEVQASMLPGGEVVRYEHVGPYELLAQSYEHLQEWMADRMLLPGDTMWEVYVTEPTGDDPNAIITEINWPATERHAGGVAG